MKYDDFDFLFFWGRFAFVRSCIFHDVFLKGISECVGCL